MKNIFTQTLYNHYPNILTVDGYMHICEHVCDFHKPHEKYMTIFTDSAHVYLGMERKFSQKKVFTIQQTLIH